MVEEGLDTEGVAGEEQGFLAGVPPGEGKHAAQTGETLDTVEGEGGEQHLGIAVAAEVPAAPGVSGPQGAEVVDGAVEDEMVAAIRRDHGLVPVGGVEDGETTHA